MLYDARTRGRGSLSAVAGAFTIVAVVLASAGCSEPGETVTRDSPMVLASTGSGGMTGDVQDAFQPWPLPPGAEAYGDIDGRHLLEYVVEQAEISRRYRDQGHPKYWGRIIGTSGDAESAEWVAAKFDEIGLSDVHIQSFDLQPQWMPQSWEVSVTSGETTLIVETAQPVYRATGTAPEGGPTIAPVYSAEGGDWYSVTVLVEKTKVLDAVEHMRQFGGSGITVTQPSYLFFDQCQAYQRLTAAVSGIN